MSSTESDPKTCARTKHFVLKYDVLELVEDTHEALIDEICKKTEEAVSNNRNIVEIKRISNRDRLTVRIVCVDLDGYDRIDLPAEYYKNQKTS